MTDIVERLRAPANWLRQDKGEQWNDAVNRYDRTPFEAAAEIDRLRAALREIAAAWEEPGTSAIARAALEEKA